MERAISPILKELLKNKKITDLCFNRYNEVYFDRGNGFERLPHSQFIFQTENEYRNFILEEISKSGKAWDAKLPFLDTLFFGTHRAHIAFPPLSQNGISVSLRRLPTRSKISHLEAQAKATERWKTSDVGFAMLVEAIEKKL